MILSPNESAMLRHIREGNVDELLDVVADGGVAVEFERITFGLAARRFCSGGGSIAMRRVAPAMHATAIQSVGRYSAHLCDVPNGNFTAIFDRLAAQTVFLNLP